LLEEYCTYADFDEGEALAITEKELLKNPRNNC
jgi:hypothetical protein